MIRYDSAVEPRTPLSLTRDPRAGTKEPGTPPGTMILLRTDVSSTRSQEFSQGDGAPPGVLTLSAPAFALEARDASNLGDEDNNRGPA